MTEVFLCFFALWAGFLDSIVGGGGLIQIPALLILLPKFEVATLFGTNKLVSITGTSIAAVQFSRRIKIDLQVTVPAALAAFVASMAGARLVTLVDSHILRPVVLIFMIAVALYTAWRPDLGNVHAPKLTGSKMTSYAIAIGLGLGFYDGFFGPGTGTFLVFAFVTVFGFDFLSASASAKIVNVATNMAALILFASTRHVLYLVALPMMACNMTGAALGSRFAILRGNTIVRKIFLLVVTLIILRYAWDIFHH